MMVFDGNRFCQYNAAHLRRMFFMGESPFLENISCEIEITGPIRMLSEFSMALVLDY